MTPRKTSKRQQNHQSQPTPLAQASDYDSDVQYFVPPPQRTNDEINLLVLRRYNPAIQTPLSIVANAVVYSFKDDPPAWEKPGIDGSLFVCQLEPHPITSGERYCLALLNRRGLENLMLELGELMEVENTPELLTLRYIEKVPGGGPDGPEKVIGLWMHADKDDTREKNGLLIEDLWKKAVKAKEAEVLAEGNGKQRAGASSTESWNMVEHQPEMSNQPGPSALGRKLSIRDLFAQKSVELPPGIAANQHRNY